jgi:hypothetical protein
VYFDYDMFVRCPECMQDFACGWWCVRCRKTKNKLIDYFWKQCDKRRDARLKEDMELKRKREGILVALVLFILIAVGGLFHYVGLIQ